MVYLYAGLGVAMLSGIMAIFEMGLAVTGQPFLDAPVDSYFTDSARGMEKKLATDLYDGWDQEFLNADPPVQISCKNLLKVDDYSWQSLEKNGLFNNSCVANNGQHRVLVKLDTGIIPYRVFTCLLDGQDDQCSFEKES
jgi:hypothetical protein